MAISFTRFKDLIATGQFEPARSNLFSVQMGIPIFMRDKLGEFGISIGVIVGHIACYGIIVG